MTLTGSIDVVGHARIEVCQGTGDSPFFCRKESWNASLKNSLKESIRLGWCIFFLLPSKLYKYTCENEGMSIKKGTFQKEMKLVFQPLFFRVDILSFRGE